jgi:hypothetical protein
MRAAGLAEVERAILKLDTHARRDPSATTAIAASRRA